MRGFYFFCFPLPSPLKEKIGILNLSSTVGLDDKLTSWLQTNCRAVGKLLIADTIKLMRYKTMKTRNSQSSYSQETTAKYIADDKPIYNVSSEVETQYNYIEKKRTDEVKGFKLYFSQEGVNPFAVKFAKMPSLPPFLSEVKLDNLEAIEIRSNVYFRAEGVSVVK